MNARVPPLSVLAVPHSEAVLARLFEVSNEPMTLTEVESGLLISVNDAFAQLTGYSIDELAGRHVVDLRLWGDPRLRERYIQRVRSEGRVDDFAATFLARDGSHLKLQLSATLFEQDGMAYLVAVMRDMSARERRRLHYEAILDNAMVGIAFTRDGKFQHANPRFEEMFGWAVGTIAGQPARVVWGSDQAYTQVGRRAGPLLAANLPFEGEFQMCKRDGTIFWASIRARAIDPDEPIGGGSIWIIDDVSERRRVQEALAAARDQAEAASRAKSEFLANTSHEIRTPLNGLLGLVRLALVQGLEPERQREYLERIQDSAEALGGTISDILDLSKIEAGRLTLEHVVFDFHSLLNTQGNAYAELARAKGLAFWTEIADDVPRWVNGDPVRVRQIISNFSNNALKFTAKGSIGIRVRCLPSGLVRLEVVDTGPGVPPHLLSRLFQPFSQADSSTTRQYGGTGLGLSICRQLAHLMHGEVGLESRVDEGSCFWAELPLEVAGPLRERHRHREVALETLRGARVLLAEDNMVNTLVAETILKQWGATTTTVVNGAQAIEAVQREEGGFDAILMDLQMPVLGGIDAAIAIRRQYGAAVLPIIALTADVLVSEREAALQHGMNEFLSKPIDPEHLATALVRWVRRARRARAELREPPRPAASRQAPRGG